MRSMIITSKHLIVIAFSAALAACANLPGPVAAGTDMATTGNLTAGEKFGMTVGASAANASDVMWAEGYGFEGTATCSGETRALFGCTAGDRYLTFQPLAMDRHGHVYLKVEHGRVSAIGWDLAAVAFSDG